MLLLARSTRGLEGTYHAALTNRARTFPARRWSRRGLLDAGPDLVGGRLAAARHRVRRRILGLLAAGRRMADGRPRLGRHVAPARAPDGRAETRSTRLGVRL